MRLILLLSSSTIAWQAESPGLQDRIQGQAGPAVRNVARVWHYAPPIYGPVEARWRENEPFSLGSRGLDLGQGYEDLWTAQSWTQGSLLMLGNEVGDPLWREYDPQYKLSNSTPTLRLMSALPLGASKLYFGLEQSDHFLTRAMDQHYDWANRHGVSWEDLAWQGENTPDHSSLYAGWEHPMGRLFYRSGWAWMPRSTSAEQDPIQLHAGGLQLDHRDLHSVLRIWRAQRPGMDSSTWGYDGSLGWNSPLGAIEGLVRQKSGDSLWESQNGTQAALRYKKTWGNSAWVQSEYGTQDFYALAGAWQGAQTWAPGLEISLASRSSWFAPQVDRPELALTGFGRWTQTQDTVKVGLALRQGLAQPGLPVQAGSAALLSALYWSAIWQKTWTWAELGLRSRGDWPLSGEWMDLAYRPPRYSASVWMQFQLPENVRVRMEYACFDHSSYRMPQTEDYQVPQYCDPRAELEQKLPIGGLALFAEAYHLWGREFATHPYASPDRLRILVGVRKP